MFLLKKLLLNNLIYALFILVFYIFLSQNKVFAIGINNSCISTQIKSEIIKYGNHYRLNGQGMLFKRAAPSVDGRLIVYDSLYILTLNHIVHGADKIKFHCPNLSFSTEELDLEVVGKSPTYDLALLKVKNYTDKSENLRTLNTLILDISQNSVSIKNKGFSFNLKDSNFKDLLYRFHFVENNELLESSAGQYPGLWPKTDSLLPYNWEFTSINGVRPGMSGSLLVGQNKITSTRQTPESAPISLVGLLAKTELNAPYSISIPFEEIVTKLNTLLEGKDPREVENTHSQIYTSMDYQYEINNANKLIRKKVLKINYLEKKIRKAYVIAEDLCQSGEYEPVSEWYSDIDDGGTTADTDGGTTADTDGGTTADTDGGTTADGTGNKQELAISKKHSNFTPVINNSIQNPDSPLKEKKVVLRSAFFKPRRCFKLGVNIFPNLGNKNESLHLIGINVQDARGVIRVDSITELFNINPFVEDLNSTQDFIDHLLSKGIFSITDKSKQHNVKSSSMNYIESLSDFYCKKNNIPQSLILPGHYLYKNDSVALQVQPPNKHGIDTLFIKLPSYQSVLANGSRFVKSFEDFQVIPLLHSLKSTQPTSDDIGYFCSVDTYLFNAKSSISAENSNLHYKIKMNLDLFQKKFNFKLTLSNELNPFTKSPEPFVLEVKDFTLKPQWSQFIDLDSGDKLELHFNPSLYTWKINVLLKRRLNEASTNSKVYPFKLLQFYFQTI